MKNFLWSEHQQDFCITHLDPSYLRINSAKDKQFQLVEPEERFLKLTKTIHRWVKKPALKSGKGNFSGCTNYEHKTEL
jgi:hypothetical protein